MDFYGRNGCIDKNVFIIKINNRCKRKKSENYIGIYILIRYDDGNEVKWKWKIEDENYPIYYIMAIKITTKSSKSRYLYTWFENDYTNRS